MKSWVYFHQFLSSLRLVFSLSSINRHDLVIIAINSLARNLDSLLIACQVDDSKDESILSRAYTSGIANNVNASHQISKGNEYLADGSSDKYITVTANECSQAVGKILPPNSNNHVAQKDGYLKLSTVSSRLLILIKEHSFYTPNVILSKSIQLNCHTYYHRNESKSTLLFDRSNDANMYISQANNSPRLAHQRDISGTNNITNNLYQLWNMPLGRNLNQLWS